MGGNIYDSKLIYVSLNRLYNLLRNICFYFYFLFYKETENILKY